VFPCRFVMALLYVVFSRKRLMATGNSTDDVHLRFGYPLVLGAHVVICHLDMKTVEILFACHSNGR
jgi:hypothetical protein